MTDPNGNGNIITQTIIVTPTSTPQAELSGKSTSNTGAIVGGVVGGIGALAAIVAGVFLLLRRRRKQDADNVESGDQSASGVHRYASTMSKAGLLRGEKQPEYPGPIATSFNRRHSRTLDQESISPISASDRRNSSFRIADQRLNPSTIFVFDNTSRASVGSLDDSRDYHRTLNVRSRAVCIPRNALLTLDRLGIRMRSEQACENDLPRLAIAAQILSLRLDLIGC